MVITDTIEGVINQSVWFHYDILGDVLYLRNKDFLKTETFSEETPDGLLVLTTENSDKPVGYTITNWWKHIVESPIPDSIQKISQEIEKYSTKLFFYSNE